MNVKYIIILYSRNLTISQMLRVNIILDRRSRMRWIIVSHNRVERQSIRENTAIGYRNRAFTIGRAPVKKLEIFHVTAYENLIHDDKAPSQYITVAESELRYLYYSCISCRVTVNEWYEQKRWKLISRSCNCAHNSRILLRASILITLEHFCQHLIKLIIFV